LVKSKPDFGQNRAISTPPFMLKNLILTDAFEGI
jgi:hypothetical protein